jgi:DNA replication and repair protein RecF
VGRLCAVVFSPSDLLLVSGAPELRRQFLDRAIFSLLPAYLGELREFKRAFRERLALLREPRPNHAHLDAWDEKIVETSARVARRRKEYIALLAARIGGIYRDVGGGGEMLSCAYKPGVGGLADAGEEDCRGIIASTIAANRSSDIDRKTMSKGVHQDDLELFLNGRIMKETASQGQRRGAAIALKGVEALLCAENHQGEALLLLDDVMSELDAGRREKLIEFLNKIDLQVVIAATDLEQIDRCARGPLQILTVRSGEIGEIPL